jgi:hypothetical protein
MITLPQTYTERGITVTRFRVDDWYRLPSATVEIRRYGVFIRNGTVESATPDSTMLWLSSEGVDSRVLLDKQDGYEVWIQPHQLQLVKE